ncbi:MAG: HAMP domain-containing histidine kinase [Acidobacteriota bacterium]|nr:HAMP domain-containing histidine kinase [Acidobacteriota bacterium]
MSGKPIDRLLHNRFLLALLVLVLLGLIAVADWRVDAETPLGFLYLLPVALAGTRFSRSGITLLALACTLLAEEFDGFRWEPQVGIPRDCLYLFAFLGVGLFVREFVTSRQRAAAHMAALEAEVASRRDAEEHLRALIHSSPLAILTTDAAGTILLANSAAASLLATPDDTLPGTSVARYLPALATVPPLRNGQTSFRTVMECRGQRSDGEEFIAELYFSTYLTSDGPRLTAMAVDMSQELRDREEANLYQMLANSRILVGAVSHEIRNLCGAIALVHQNLTRTPALRGNQDFESLGTLVVGLERVAAIELRNSTSSAPLGTTLDLVSFFEELRVILAPALREQNIQTTWSLQPLLPPVWADRQSLTQVFLNLTRNAQEALATQTARTLHFAASSSSGAVHITVTDNGPGVPSPELLFRPFQQQARQTGLGLFLSRALLRSFKGDLQYQATPAGASFIVELCPVQHNFQEETL